MSRIVVKTIRVLICDCGKEHIIDEITQSERLTKAPTVVPTEVKVVTKQPEKTQPIKYKEYRFSAVPSLDIEDFVTEAKQKLGGEYATTTQFDDRIKKTGQCIRTGRPYSDVANDETEIKKMSVIAITMGYRRHVYCKKAYHKRIKKKFEKMGSAGWEKK